MEALDSTQPAKSVPAQGTIEETTTRSETGPFAGRRPPAGTERRTRRRAAAVLLPVLTTAALIGAWELGARTGVLPAEVPGPTAVATWLRAETGHPGLWNSIGNTLAQTLLGIIVGGAAGIVLGVLMMEIPLLSRLLQSSLEFLRPIPGIVYMPLVILVFGAVPKTSVVLVAVAVLWPMLFQTMYGVRSVDPLLRDAGRMFGLTLRQRLTSITAPSIAPYLLTGLRLSLSVALIMAISTELIAGVPGLGWDLTQYRLSGNYAGVYGVVVISGVLGVLANVMTTVVERRALHWHVSQRSGRR